jgi:putative membrane protein
LTNAGGSLSDLNDPRVLFAAERTLLAWNRTSLSIIAFGFVVERAGLLIPATESASAASIQAQMTFWIGLSFIALGAFASGFSVRQYALVLRTLNAAEFPPGYTGRWGMVVNIAISMLAVMLMFALLLART